MRWTERFTKEKGEKRECSEKSNTSEEQQLQILIIQTSMSLSHTNTHVGFLYFMRTADKNAQKKKKIALTSS